MKPQQCVTIAGAGLAGSLLATLLARKGWQVELIERRGDPRKRGYEGGRSINLALAERGMHALRLAGLEQEVLDQAIMMRGRMVNFTDGTTELQPYGRNDAEVIWSVHRGRLNISLLNAADQAGANLQFNARVESIDFDKNILHLHDELSGTKIKHAFDVLIGADGAGSAVRQEMSKHVKLNERFEPLGHSCKELEIPPAPDGGFRIEPQALHIWPRGNYMCIALPNTERTFTVTLFLPNDGKNSFAALPDLESGLNFFQRDFGSAAELMPQLRENWEQNPVSPLGTLYIDHWHYADKAVLIGDAAHAMVPFHGQGMNCAFEDCVAMLGCIEQEADWQTVFEQFEFHRRDNAFAIQAMAIENYTEMRDRVDDDDYRLQRQLELELARRHPDLFVPRYSMVSFTRIPYADAFQRGRVQRALLIECTQGLKEFGQIDLQKAGQLVVERLGESNA